MGGTCIVSCGNGHYLRVPTDKGALRVTCPKCRDSFDWAPAPMEAALSEPSHRPRRWGIAVGGGAAVMAACIGGWVWFSGGQHVAQRAMPLPPAVTMLESADDRVSVAKPVAGPQLVSQALPPTGWNYVWYSGEPRPTLMVETRGVPGHHYVKVEDWATKKVVAVFFIQEGQRHTMKLPAGDYRVKVANGGTWYGVEHLFGPATGCFVLDARITLTEMVTETETGTEVQWTKEEVSLYKRQDGNLHSSKIRVSDF